MGVVYRAHDPATDRYIALKRLISDSQHQVQMFEREYHTLRSLRHPRIIEVFDYGVEHDAAYYTMELLDGADLKELAPLSYKRTCAYLRDVASSLGLLHARRMLHRDLSPRNVRVTSEDRAKLIDFGGLTIFGVPDVVVGTPPCIPPEALNYTSLDQRADLYSLGALAYWLLTGRHAYPAREMTALPEAWRGVPVPPSELATTLELSVPPIPRELDELVTALLTLNPMGRPASAAEVIDRLEQIGGLERDSDEAASQSYLLGVVSVGRERERERLSKRLSSALEGEGAGIVLEGQSGMGGTQLLSELTVEAQLAGALPSLVDASIDRGAYGVVHRLIAKLLEAAPSDALAAAEGHQAMLARFSPDLRAALQVSPDETDFSATPGELRKRTQTALSEWLVALAAQRPLLLAVDNAQRMDDGSVALLTALSTVASKHALMIVACAKAGDVRSVPGTVRTLRMIGASMVLRGLELEDVRELVRLLFGAVPNTERLADWMHRLSGGNPRACMDLAVHLVDNHVIRYIQGTWVLPQELSAVQLPESLDAIITYRLQRLPEAARGLAEALAVHRGALPLLSCLALAQKLAIEAPYDALDALTREGVLRVSGNSYHFAHDAVREHVLAAVSDARRRELHRMLGALLAVGENREDVNASLDAGWHLLHGGEEQRGAALLADAGLRLTYSSDEMSSAVPALRAALDVYRRLKRPIHEQLRLLTPLAMAGYYCDRRLADEFGEEALRLQRRHLGLDLAARLRPLLGRHLSTYLALGLTGLRFMLRPALGGVRAMIDGIVDHIACCTALAGVAAICLDGEGARRYASYFEPLLAFDQDHGVHLAYGFVKLLAFTAEENFTGTLEGFSQILKRLENPKPIRHLKPEARKMLYGGVLYALASMDVFRAESKVLEYAKRLDRIGLKLYEMVADQLRTNYHALRGETDLAESYRARVEMHAVQAGSVWQAEVWTPCSMIIVNVLSGDTIGLKRTMEQLDRLAQEIPSLVLHARMVRAEYHFLKGEYEQGFAIARPEIESTPDRGFMGRTFAISSQAHALNRLGRYSDAKTLLEPLVENLSDADKDIVAHYSNLSRELAHAYSGLGDHPRAFAIIDAMIERHARSEHPLLLGNLHATATAIALVAGEPSRALEHLKRMEDAFRPTGNPALIAQWEQMRREVVRLLKERAPEAAAALGGFESSTDYDTASAMSLLSQCNGADQRAQFALDILINHMRAKRGFLFSYERGDLRLIAPQHGLEPSTQLVDRIRHDIEVEVERDDVTVVAGLPVRSSIPPPLEPKPVRADYHTFLLTIPYENDVRIVGVVAIEAGNRTVNYPQKNFLRTLARSLFEAGDAGTSDKHAEK